MMAVTCRSALRVGIPRFAFDKSTLHYILLYKMTGEERDQEGRRAQLLKGLAELALLSLLAEGPRYGLDILEGLRREAGLAIAEGTIYPLLHRLERATLVTSEWRLEEEGARPRKYYALTDVGRAELAKQLSDWRQISTDLTRFLERKRK
jgi:PadR family transcriptional regulator PadR